MFYSHLIIGLFSPKKYRRVEKQNFLETYKTRFRKNIDYRSFPANILLSEDVLKTSRRRLQNFIKTNVPRRLPRRLEDLLKTLWRRNCKTF